MQENVSLDQINFARSKIGLTEAVSAHFRDPNGRAVG
jgi:hypothetical protein